MRKESILMICQGEAHQGVNKTLMWAPGQGEQMKFKKRIQATTDGEKLLFLMFKMLIQSTSGQEIIQGSKSLEILTQGFKPEVPPQMNACMDAFYLSWSQRKLKKL